MRNVLGTLALVVGGVLVALLLGETVARVLGRVGTGAVPAAETGAPDPALEGLPELEGILELARPNVRGVFGGVLHRTNRAGMRGPQYVRVPPPGTFRVAVGGDSFTMGAGVAEEETYAAQLQALLEAASSGTRFEVMNLGLGGLDVRRVVGRIERIGLPFGPRLVVYGFTVNDIESPGEAIRERSEGHNRILLEWLRFADSPSHLLRALWPRLVSLREKVWQRPGSYLHRLASDYDDPEKWRRIEQGLDRLAALGERLGICVHVLVHTEVADLYVIHPFSEIYDRVGEAARERGLTVTQSLPYYRWKNAWTLRVSVIDSHPNAEGHRLLAEALFDGLRDLPARCGPPPIGEAHGRRARAGSRRPE